MQNCYWMAGSFLCYQNCNESGKVETEGSCGLCSPSEQDEMSDVKDSNKTTLEEETWCGVHLVARTRSSWKCKPYSILSQLKDLYHQELLRNPTDTPQTSTTCHLLGKLVERERYNMVVITLNPPGEGFTVSFQLENGSVLEERAKYPYTQDTLLDYIDKRQLPAPFLDYWQQSVPQLFYDGCVICQVKDFRHGSPARIEHVLLGPHSQSLVSDINKLLMDSDQLWTPNQQFTVESNIVNNANRSLCLDPSPDVGKMLFKLHQDCNAFDNSSIRRLIDRNSPLSIMRKRKYEHCLPRCNPFLCDFIDRKKARSDFDKNSPIKFSASEAETKIPRWNLSGKDVLSQVCRSAKAVESKPESDDFTPRLIKEWILETKNCHVRLTILQRPVNFEYLCQIYMDNRYVEGKSTGSTCRFTLGSRDNAHRFVTQYIELYTAEGRQKVSITQLGPGQIIK